MNVNIDLCVGDFSEIEASPNQCSKASINFEMHHQKINEHINMMRNNLGKYRLPLIIVDLPQSAKDVEINLQSVNPDEQYYEVNAKQRVYKCLQINDKEINALKKKIQKGFNKLTQLDNKCLVQLQLFNIDKISENFKANKSISLAQIFLKFKLLAKVNLDANFYDALQKLVQKIAPKFADSPIMAILPLLGDIDIGLQLDSLQELDLPNKELLFNQACYEQNNKEEQREKILKNITNKDKANIFINFDTLGYIHAQFEFRILYMFLVCLGIV